MARGSESLTAAATVLPLRRPKDVAKALGSRQEWQGDAWAFFDEVPEFKQATWFTGNAMAKLRLFVAEVPAGDEPPQPADAEGSSIAPEVAAAAQAELVRLRSGLSGAGEILRDANMNLEVAAEAFLIGWGPRAELVDERTGEVTREAAGERWEIRSIDELKVKGSGASTKYFVHDGPSDQVGVQLNPELDTAIRIYQPHPRWKSMADGAVRGVLGELEALVVLHRQVIAEANSRASAGLLTVPNELGLGPVEVLDAEGQEAQQDPFMDDLSEALVAPIDDPGHPAATTPFLVRGPAQYLTPEYLRRITFDREAASTLDARIEARVQRLARGLNLPVEKVLGHQQTTFANAEQVDQDLFDEHLEPRAVLLVNALTLAFLRAQLRDDSSPVRDHPDVDRVMIWFDPSALVRQPDTQAGAAEALEQNAISLAAYRRAKGWSEDDAPSEEELLQRAGLRRGILTADLTLALLQMLGQAGADLVVKPIGTPMAQPVGPDGELLPTPDAPADGAPPADPGADSPDGVAAAGTRAHGPVLVAAAQLNPGRQLMDIDRDLRTRLIVASDAAMDRALEKAGARLRSKLGRRRELVAGVPNQELLVRLGDPGRLLGELALSTEELLGDAWAGLRAQFMAWGGEAQAAALETAARVVAGFTRAEREALMLRQAQDLEEAWSWLEAHISTHANDLFTGAAAIEDLGETLGSLRVPPGMLRQAIAQAGGVVLETAGISGGAWVSVTADGRAPGGIGTGDLIMGALSDHGAGTEGYRWVYGMAVRKTPFEPHVELDGVEFANFDDDVLANTSGFPDFAFYMPGDHAGCICDFEPIIMSPEEG